MNRKVKESQHVTVLEMYFSLAIPLFHTALKSAYDGLKHLQTASQVHLFSFKLWESGVVFQQPKNKSKTKVAEPWVCCSDAT